MKKRFYILMLLFAVLCGRVMASGVDSLLSQLPKNVRLCANRIYFPSGVSQQTYGIMQKIRSLAVHGEGYLNVLHIGGSHIQADMYTNVLRRRLSALSGTRNPSRGFIFPFSVAKTNNPVSYSVKYGGEWSSARNSANRFLPVQGLAGINIQTADTSAWFSVDLNADSSGLYKAREVKIMGFSRRGNIEPVVVLADSSRVRASGVQRDSVALSSVYAFSMDPACSFRVELEFDEEAKSAADTFTVTGLFVQNRLEGVTYSAIGVNGAAVPSYLKCGDFRRDLSIAPPHLVVFALGVNDASHEVFNDTLFIENYNKLIANIRQVAPSCALLFLTNSDFYRRDAKKQQVVNLHNIKAQNAFYRLAAEWQGGVWDLYHIMGGLGSVKDWEEAGLAGKDKIHFTRDGYQLIGSLLFEALMTDYFAAPLVTNYTNNGMVQQRYYDE